MVSTPDMSDETPGSPGFFMSLQFNSICPLHDDVKVYMELDNITMENHDQIALLLLSG